MLPETKAPGTRRIFIFGESAAYGDPNPDFGLPRVLETLLRERFPETKFEVVNAAMTGINSHVIRPIAEECARENGDVWVVYMGNNEVVGPFGGGTVFGPQAPSLPLIRASLALKSTRIGQLMDNLLTRAAGAGARSAGNQWGMSLFIGQQVRQSDPRMARVYSHFERNLKDILEAGRAHGAKVVVSTVVSNLKDCPPFGSLHRNGLTEAELRQWDQLFTQACHAEEAGALEAAATQFQAAAAIDDQYAVLQFRWARCCLALGREELARQHFILARDDDALRFRADSRLNGIIRDVSAGREREGIVLVDGEQILAGESPHGLPGSEWLYEHVHLNFAGNCRLAQIIAEQVAKSLPEGPADPSRARPEWASPAECARRLAWTDWDRYKTFKVLLLRLNEPPFNATLDHGLRYGQLQRDMEQLLPATAPASWPRTAAQYREALGMAPQDWVLRRNLADLQLKMGDQAGARASLERVATDLPFDTMAHLQLGSLLVQAGEPDLAVAQFQRALELDPSWVPALNGLALAYLRQGHQPEAIAQLETTLQLEPEAVETRLNLGYALETAGRLPEAVEQFRQALQGRLTTPDNLLSVGRMALRQGWVEAAITNLTRAVGLNPTDAGAHYYLGRALITARRAAEAQPQFA
jgi:tetratricopeptide (TPR) repeat protein